MDSIQIKGGCMKKILIFLIMAPFFLIAQEGFSKRGGPEGRPRMEHRRQQAQERHEMRHEKAQEKIEKQHQRKTEKLEQWKTKRLEKCGSDQACIDRVNRKVEKKDAQIEKQYEKRQEALKKYEEKHPAEKPAAPSEGGTQAPSTGGAPMTESR